MRLWRFLSWQLQPGLLKTLKIHRRCLWPPPAPGFPDTCGSRPRTIPSPLKMKKKTLIIHKTLHFSKPVKYQNCYKELHIDEGSATRVSEVWNSQNKMFSLHYQVHIQNRYSRLPNVTTKRKEPHACTIGWNIDSNKPHASPGLYNSNAFVVIKASPISS